jgi:hypothetical protein
MAMTDIAGTKITADFDFLQTGPQTWDITVTAEDGVLRLSSGGAKIEIDGKPVVQAADAEYPGSMRGSGSWCGPVEVRAPLALVADAFLVGRGNRGVRITVLSLKGRLPSRRLSSSGASGTPSGRYATPASGGGSQFTCRSRPSQYGARSSRRRIFPEAFLGRASMKSTLLGALKPAIRSARRR